MFPENISLLDLTSLHTLKLCTAVPGYSLIQDLPCDFLPLLSTQAYVPTMVETICLDFHFMSVLDVNDPQHSDSIAERPGTDASMKTKSSVPVPVAGLLALAGHSTARGVG